MSKQLTALFATVSSLFALGVTTPAPAAAAGVTALRPAPGTAAFRLRSRPSYRYNRPSYGSRYRGYGYGRRGLFHGFGGTILKGLGIAYLFHAVFGWGAGGGSPFGLLIVLAFVAWLVTRRRRVGYRPY